MDSAHGNAVKQSNSVSVKDRDSNKRHRNNSNSAGSKHHFRDRREKKRKQDLLNLTCDPPAAAVDVEIELSDFECGCNRGILEDFPRTQNISSCILRNFLGGDIIDRESSSTLIMYCREKLRKKTSIERDLFLDKLIESMVGSETILERQGSGESSDRSHRLVMHYSLPWRGVNISVCAESLAFAYGVTPSRLKHSRRSVKDMRTSEIDMVNAEKIRRWTDKKYHGYTYDQITDIFTNNLPGEAIDDLWIQSGMAPYSDIQQHALLWLNEFVKTFGDAAPNGAKTQLASMKKKQVWCDYKAYMASCDPPRDAVDHSTFNNLWNVVFPHYIVRPYVNVCGKCDTCYEIDRMRHSSKETSVHEALAQCHAMHGAGNFKLERMK